MRTARTQPSMIDPDQHFFNEAFGGIQTSDESNYFMVNQDNSTFITSSTYINFIAFNITGWNNNSDKFTSLLNSLNSLTQTLLLAEIWLSLGEQNTCLLDGYTEYYTQCGIGEEAGRGEKLSL